MRLSQEVGRLWPEGIIARWLLAILGAALALSGIWIRHGSDTMLEALWSYVALGLVPLAYVCIRGVWLYSRFEGKRSNPSPDDRRKLLRLSASMLAGVAGGLGFSVSRVLPSRTQFSPLEELEGKYLIRKRIQLSDLVSPIRPVLRDLVFDDCDLYGPAVIFFSGRSVVTHCAMFSLGQDLNMFWETDHPITGCVAAIDCEFKGCRFHFIGFAGPKDFIDMARKSEVR